jgi:RimJ/RimL family protein N-acetyltransferase
VNDRQVEFPIRTQRLLLRPYDDGDVDALHDIHRRDDVTRFLPWNRRTRDDVQAMVERRKPLTRLERDGDGLLLVVLVAPDGPLVGDVDLQLLSVEHRQGEIGYVLHPAHQGHGYATEAAEALLRIGFETYDLHRIVGKVDARNEASGRVLERLGMRREAVFRENEWFKGEWTTEVVYAILADEWRARSGGSGSG